MKVKNFKRVIAVALSVLTILMTLPLTAFATPATSNDNSTINLTLGDKLRYDPNINWTTHQMYADGRMAYCVNPKLPAPSGKYGSSNLTAVSQNSNTFAMLYKGLHYGYDGHGFNTKVTAFGNKSMKQLMDKAKSDHWLGASGNSLYYLLTHRVLAKIYGDKDWSYALSSDWIKAVNEIEAALKKAAKLKAEYDMYLLDPKNNQQKVIIMQDKLGGLEIIKDSSNHTLTDNSGCYSLKGAEFTVTNTKTKKTYTITASTKVNDGSATVKYKAVLKNIVAGTYTIKETKAPKGYALAKETKTVTVKADTANTSIKFKNTPQNDPVRVLVEKSNGNGKAVANAEFTVKFYKGYFKKTEIESGKADSAFKRYWTLKTDSDGYAELSEDYLVDSNNDFYYSSPENPIPILPLGTVTIQETKAPAGYTRDTTLYVQQITGNSSGNSSVYTYNKFENVNNPSTYYELKKTSEDGIVAGVSFKIYEGNKVDNSKYLKTVKTNANGEIKEKLDVGTYTFDEVVSDKYIKQEPVTVTITAENTSAKPAEISFANKLKDGKLKISKTASDGNIAGIAFEVYKGSNTAGQLVGTYVTDNSGLITKDIKAGTYCIHEIVPDGYRPVSDQVVTIKANEERTVTFRNVKSGSQVKIIKDTDNYDAGPFTCKVEGISNDLKMDIDIDTYEPTIINLEDGKYRITEILTDEQKALWQEIKPIEFIVDHNKELTTVTLQNHEKTGSVKVIKTASDNYIEGKQFSLYGVSSAGFEIKYCYATTNKDGIAVFDNIPVGKYVLEEVSSHAIYNLKSDVDLNGVMVEWDKVTEVNIRNDEKTTPFEVVKTSEDGNLKGFEFEITGTTTSGDSVKLTNLITDDKGRITGNLYPGTYEAREVKTPNKYIQPREQKFTIEQTTNDNPAPVQLFFYNELKKGSLEITKTAYDGFIENVAFSLTSKEDSSVVYHAITNAKGIAKFENIPIGAYKLREENIGEQYIEIGDINVVINYNEITKQSVENKPKDGYLKVIKTSDSKNLKGFEFEVTGTTWDNKEIRETYTTDENGLIVAKLPTGTYTVQEVNAPSWFIPVSETTLELTPYDTSDEPYTINVYNEYKRGSLKVFKSADDNFIENIKFNLSGTADCGEKINITVTTNTDGCAEFNNIPIGTYTLSELTKEDRYVTVLDSKQTIEWNKVISVSVNNKLKTGEIQTTAHDAETGEHYAYANENTKIVDTVAYKNIAANQTYKLTGTIMDKETGEPLLINDEKVVVSKEFVSSPTGTGTVDIEFSFNSIDLVGKSIVVFEKLSIKDKDNNDYVLAVHSDINDEGQTIVFKEPKIRTTAHNTVSNNNTAVTSAATTIVDTVTYSDLIVGKEYTVTGTLMVKSSGKELTDSNGSPITASKTFTAENTDGSIEMEFTFDSSLLAGESVVAFERLYYNGREIAVHTDINDGEQTVTFSEPPTEPTIPTEPTKPTTPPTEPTVPTRPATFDTVGQDDNIDSNGTPAQITSSGNVVSTGAAIPILPVIIVLFVVGIIVKFKNKAQ
ncbi:SpaA isopeptide-forming pilin-related protein [Oscillospiraceae bacterium LCP25S3_F9]